MQLQFAIAVDGSGDDRTILEYAFNDDRILVTANVMPPHIPYEGGRWAVETPRQSDLSQSRLRLAHL